MTATEPTAKPTGTPDDDAIGEAAARLRLATTRLFRTLRRRSRVDLTLSQLATLSSVKRCGPLPIGALAEEEGISPPTATKLVDKLHRSGHLARSPHPTDRRVTVVSVTDEGDRVLAEIRDRRTAWLAGRLADLPPGDLQRLLDAIDILERLSVPPTDDEPHEPPRRDDE